MSATCCNANCTASKPIPPSYRRALWIALVVNLAMFGVEMVAGWGAGSASLLADAVDFFGDAANYGLSLFVLSMSLAARARTAMLKGVSMGAYGLYVLAQATWNGVHGVVPEALAMGIVGTVALVANVGVAVLLYAYRDGDANMRSVWLCSRNDAIGNLAILLAALGVFGTGSAWPDLGVATLMAVLGLFGATQVIRQARMELRSDNPRTSAAAIHP
ncbi:cation transporter [Stagnimonas aquatica]|uniref:Cation transporter n=1 Tax=Stagnimonas aquatica TaxID=2689987 RepID=A0A3N0VAR7_9GAMM|nr:cation transporter [Stagnimonas aquatica]ROH89694.1 cation transporter [Stagnimonas aquatica]